MSKLAVLLALLLMVSLIGCDSDDTGGYTRPAPTPTWSAQLVVVGGRAPQVSPDDTKLLFVREGEGLFLWENGIESRITPSDATARPDYSWSVSGNDGFAFSIPGEPGQGAAIFVRNEEGTLLQVWDRGSAPHYNSAEGYVLCAGPAESETESGVWKITLSDLRRERLTEVGDRPRLGVDGDVFLYLIPDALSVGAQLVARSVAGLALLMQLDHVSKYQSRIDNSTVLVELVVDPNGVTRIPAVFTTEVFSPPPLNLIAQPAIDAVLLESGILLNKLMGDTLGGLYLIVNDAEYLVADSLFEASANNSASIYAVGEAGIYLLTEN